MSVGATASDVHADKPRSDVRSLARGGALTLVSSVTGTFLGFLLTVVVTRGLQARAAGAFFVAVGLFTILSNTTELGADTGLVRAISRARALGRTGDLRRLVRVAMLPVLIGATVIAVAMFALAPALADLVLHGIARHEATQLLRVLAPFLPIGAASAVVVSGTRGFGTMIPYVALEYLGKPALRPLLMLAVVFAGLGIGAASLAWALPLAIGFVVALAMTWRLIRAAERAAPGSVEPARPRGALAGEFWRFAGPRGFAGIFQATVVWLDVLLIGAFRSTAEAGIYTAASKLAMLGTFGLEAVRLALAPQISGLLARNEHRRVEHLYQIGTWWMVAMCWPLYVGLLLYGSLVLKVFGPEFAAGETALLVLSLAALIDLGTGNVTVMLLMGGKSSWNMINTLAALVVNIGLNVLLLPRMGITGAAIAWAASIAVDNLAALVEVWLFLGLSPFGRGYLRVSVQAVACYGLVGLVTTWWLGVTIPSLLVFGVVATVVYAVLVWRSRGLLELATLAEAVRLRLKDDKG